MIRKGNRTPSWEPRFSMVTSRMGTPRGIWDLSYCCTGDLYTALGPSESIHNLYS